VEKGSWVDIRNLIVLHPCVLTRDSNRQVLDGTSYQLLFERIDFKESDMAWTLERSVARKKILGERGTLPFVNSAHALIVAFATFKVHTEPLKTLITKNRRQNYTGYAFHPWEIVDKRKRSPAEHSEAAGHG